jgi:polysaccharide export outer membrane protein
MRNKDVIYVSNSVSVEATKFMTYIRQIGSTVNDPINYAINGFVLRNLIKSPAAVTTGVFTGSAPVIGAPVAP